MTTPVEDPAVTTPVQSQTSRKMLQLLRKRLRQLLWATLGLAIFLAVAGGIFAIWWLTSLNGLPDIGDPFDVAELRAFKIPDDQNAFTYFRRAQVKLTPMPELPRAARATTSTVAWSKADPKLRAWVEANRPALELFLQGADRSDGISHPAGEPFSREYSYFYPNRLMRLAMLEGGRRTESGDTASAWDCYRAVLRGMTHLRRRGNLSERFVANTLNAPLRQRLTTWAADPKTTIPQLRRALDEVIESQPRPEWDVFSLKIEYLYMIRVLDEPRTLFHRALDEDLTYRLGDFQVPNDLAMYLYGGLRFLKREPERSRRVVQLVFANWLAHAEVPELQRSRPAVRASYHYAKSTTSVLLYPTSPKAPAAARGLTPGPGKLARHDQGRQALFVECALAIGSYSGTKELPRPGRPAGRSALSTRAWSAPTFRVRPGGALSRVLARRRFGRARRWYGTPTVSDE